jgi:aryl carrier-like protein
VRFAGLKFRGSTAKTRCGAKKNAGNLRGQLSNVSSPAEAVNLILKAITNKLISMFASSEADVAPSKNLAEVGVDSLIAVELRNWITSQTGLGISIFEFRQSPSLMELANIVATNRGEVDIS